MTPLEINLILRNTAALPLVVMRHGVSWRLTFESSQDAWIGFQALRGAGAAVEQDDNTHLLVEGL